LNNQANWDLFIPSLKREGVILIAVLTDSSDREKALHAGFTDYLLHPILEEELYSRLVDPELIRGLVDKQDGLIFDQAHLVAVGRLVSHFCHEINNSMQAIGGALTLATEEPGLTDGINTYLSLSKDETQRVTLLVRKMRQLYRRADVLSVTIQMNELVKETAKIAREELDNNGIHLVEEYEKDLPPIEGSYELVQLAILNVLFLLSDHLNGTINRTLNLHLTHDKAFLQLHVAVEGDSNQTSPSSTVLSETASFPKAIMAHSPAHEILASMGGELLTSDDEKGLSVRMRFPIKRNDSGAISDG
jgi:signal transduction histidine kinase